MPPPVSRFWAGMFGVCNARCIRSGRRQPAFVAIHLYRRAPVRCMLDLTYRRGRMNIGAALTRAVSSMVEHFVYTEGVRSSSLLPPKAFRDRWWHCSSNVHPMFIQRWTVTHVRARS